MPADWYYATGDTVHGPVTATELRELARNQAIRGETPVRKGTDGKWAHANRVRGLFDAPVPLHTDPAAAEVDVGAEAVRSEGGAAGAVESTGAEITPSHGERVRRSSQFAAIWDNRGVNLGIVALGCLAFMSTAMSRAGRPSVLVSYLSLMIAVFFCAKAIVHQVTKPRVRRFLPVFAAVLCAVGFFQFDYYTTMWTSVEINFGKEQQVDGWLNSSSELIAYPRTEYVDYHRRRNGEIYYRELWMYEKGHTQVLSSRGPMTPSNKPHGEWTSINWRDNFRTTHEWYWYGDKVTEGEWHLRSR